MDNIMASLPSKIPAGKVIGDITALRSQDLRDHLQKIGIKFNDGTLKPQLQALLALHNLGLLKKGGTPNENLVAAVTDWCNISVKKLVSKLKYKKLDTSGTRWKHVEVLIRAELDTGETALAKLDLSWFRKTVDGSASSLHDAKPILTPSPAVVNLLLTTIYAEVARSKDLASLPECPTTTVAAFLKHLDTFPTFKTAEGLEAARKAPLTPAKVLLNWICDTQGDHIAEATGSLKINGMPDGVVQFVVSKPNEELERLFSERKRQKGCNSILLFHGTRIPNLRDILLTNFVRSFHLDAVWMAENPSDSYDYAAGVAGNGSYIQPSMWKGDPYMCFGALLGCEVAGKGTVIFNTIHTIQNPDDIMVKYIFLLPPTDMPKFYMGPRKAPGRKDVADDIVKNFAKI